MGVFLTSSKADFSNRGISNWLLQRIAACVMMLYIVFVVSYLVSNPELQFYQWRSLHDLIWMRLLSLSAVLALACHSYIGLWCVFTDYVTDRLIGPMANSVRKTLQGVALSIAAGYVGWAIMILWGT